MSLHSEYRRWIKALPAEARVDGGVVVGLSGGADSLALTRASVKLGLQVHAVVVDHQLQPGSDEVARTAVAQAEALGAASARVVTVDVSGNNEDAARRARYAALGEAAAGLPVLVAHTENDDAEGLLLGLIRGSGTQSLAGMRPVSFEHPVVEHGAAWLGRPLLTCSRDMTEAECALGNLDFWQDPHNSSTAFLRSRLRSELLPQLEALAGPAVSGNLARTARLLRADADALSAEAERIHAELEAEGAITPTHLECARLSRWAGSLRRRIIKRWLSPTAGALTSEHLTRIEELAVDYHGQGAVSVPWHTMDEHVQPGARLVVTRRGAHLIVDVSKTEHSYTKSQGKN